MYEPHVPGARYKGAMRAITVLLVAALALAGVAQAQTATANRLPLRNLLVEVRHGEASRFEQQAAGVDQAGVVVGSDGSVRGSAQVTIGSAQGRSSGDATQQLTVLNGREALLRVAAQVPLQWLELAWTTDGPALIGGSQLVDVGRQVAVRPSWPGGQAPVTVEVRTEAAALASGGMRPRYAPDGQPLPEGGIDRAGVLTTMQLPLGQWVTVARSGEEAQRSERGTLSTRELAGSRGYLVQMRVSVP